MNGFATELVNGEDSKPVPGQSAGADEDDLAGCGVAEVEVEVCALVEAHGGKEGGGGEAEAIEGEVEEAVGSVGMCRD